MWGTGSRACRLQELQPSGSVIAPLGTRQGPLPGQSKLTQRKAQVEEARMAWGGGAWVFGAAVKQWHPPPFGPENRLALWGPYRIMTRG